MGVKASRDDGLQAMPGRRGVTRRVNSLWVRRQNAALLFRSLRLAPGSSQRLLAAATGLDKATVSAVVAQLVEAGLVVRAAAPAREGRSQGRPEVALDIPASAGLVLGTRLEPDSIEIVAADLAGRVVDRESRPSARDAEAAIGCLAEGVAALAARLAPLKIHAIGVGVPALITSEGHLVLGPNLGWRDLPIGRLLRARLPIPSRVENDTKAAAIAERLFGCCGTIDDFLYLTGHSGVGGAVTLGGEIYRGADGLAGEIGHVKVVEGGRPCGCGSHGCLEAHTSERALLLQAREAGIEAGSVRDLARLAEARQPEVLALLVEAGRLFARALAGPVNLLNPARVVLGGNLAVVGPWMLEALQAELTRLALAPLAQRLDIRLSPLGADAVVMGGVALALEDALEALLSGTPAPLPSAEA